MSRQSCFRLLSSPLLGFAIVIAATGSGFGQGYTAREYDDYQRAVEGGPDTLIEWYKTHPASTLREYAVPQFIEWVRRDAGEGKLQEAVATGEKFLAEVDGEHFEMLNLTTHSAYNGKLWEKTARYGEKVYQAKSETPDILKILAYSYLQLSNTPKIVEYGEAFCAQSDLEECHPFYRVIARYHVERKDWAKAEAAARKLIESLDAAGRPEGAQEQEWNKYVNSSKADAHSIVGKVAYERGAWKAAQGAYQKLLQLSARDDGRRAEAYYFIGMTRWRLQEFAPAMEAFSKGAQLPGAEMAKHCDSQLKVLYRATHNGSLAGLDEFLDEHPPD